MEKSENKNKIPEGTTHLIMVEGVDEVCFLTKYLNFLNGSGSNKFFER